jgi:hypothetical protein
MRLVENNLIGEDCSYWIFPNDNKYTKNDYYIDEAETAYLSLKIVVIV